MSETDYRARLYPQYLSTRGVSTASGIESEVASRAPYLDRLIRRYLSPSRGTRILELGCGSGTLLARLGAAGYLDAVGVDASEEQVQRARARGIHSVTKGDVFETLEQLEARSKDAILAFDIIEHLTKKEVVRLTEEVSRVLSPTGIWIIHTVNGESPFFGRVRYGDFTHETTFTQRSIRQILLASGFRSVQCHEDAPVVHGIASLGRAALWSVVRIGVRLMLAAETGDIRSPMIISQNFLTIASK